MRRIEDARKKYEEITVPDELSKRILTEIRKSDEQRKKKKVLFWCSRYGAAAALLVVMFTVGLNTSVTFAEAAKDIPVIGAVARVLTFRSYETETEDLRLAVDIPSIDMISEEFGNLETSVNEEIHRLCEKFADKGVEHAEEYRQAFLDTGGTKEEWEAHNLEVKVWYEVKSQTDRYLSLEIMGSENWNSAGFASRYYNFDLETGKLVGLKDILGENYAETAQTQIVEQMWEREQEGAVFFEDPLLSITEDTKFYINQNNSPVIVFDKYEIAPGSEGIQEFELRESEAP